MTSPKQARDTSDGRYYTHPVTGEQLVSITNVLSSIAKPALVPAAVKITADTAADLAPLLIAAMRVQPCTPKRVAEECGQCFDCHVKRIKRQYKVVWEHAADTGTLVHRYAEAHLTGEQLPHNDDVEPFMEQYLRFLDDFDIDIRHHIEAAELTVAHPDLGLAGTLDVIAHMRLDGYLASQPIKQLPGNDRALWVYDIKTSLTKPADTLYPEQPLQLTAQRHAREAWLPDGTVTAMPKHIVGTAILNLRTDSYAFIPVPSGQPEWDAYKGFLTGTKWLHRHVTKDLAPITPDGKTPTPAKTRTPAKKATPTTRKAA